MDKRAEGLGTRVFAVLLGALGLLACSSRGTEPGIETTAVATQAILDKPLTGPFFWHAKWGFTSGPNRLEAYGNNQLASVESGFAITDLAAGDVIGDGSNTVAYVAPGSIGFDSATAQITNPYPGVGVPVGVSPRVALGNLINPSANDRKAELVVADGPFGNFGQVVVYSSTGQVTNFLPDDVGYFTGDDLAICDLNGDGLGELVIGDPSRFEIFGSVNDPHFSHTAPGQHTDPGDYFAGRQPVFNLGDSRITCADLDNDGSDEIIVGGNDGDCLQIFSYPGKPQVNFVAAEFPGGQGCVTFGQNTDLTAGDLNGDGFAEIIVGKNGAQGLDGAIQTYSSKDHPLGSFANGFSTYFGGEPLAAIHLPKVTTNTTTGFAPFHLQNIFYDPPGAATQQEYGTDYTVDTTTTWQLTEKNGVSVTAQVNIGKQDEVGATISSSVQYQWESISGSGVSSTRTDSTAYDLPGQTDIPSGLYDQFFLVLAVPTTIVDYSDGRNEQVTLHYDQGKPVLLNGQQLLGLAQNAANVDDLLKWTLTTTFLNQADLDAMVALVKAMLAGENARSILLLDPNFFIDSSGAIALRDYAQLNAFVQAHSDRFQPVPVSLGGIPLPGTGTALPNTLPVPPGKRPVNGPQQDGAYHQSLSNSSSAAVINGNGTDLQFQLSVGITIPIYAALSGQGSVGYAYEEEYQKVTTTTKTSGTDDSVVVQMGSPCIAGRADIYYDALSGTYFYVSHDIQTIIEPPNSAFWWDKECAGGNTKNLQGTTCTGNGDCASQVCTNGRCAPASCAPNCSVGSNCGLGGPFGDCSSQECDVGLCATVQLDSTCILSADCATLSCVGGACATPTCSPTCQQYAGCGVDGDCLSHVCSEGFCLPPACSPTCAEGAACGANGDCATGVCTNGVCAPPACAPTCADGTACASNSECGSKVCKNGVCTPPACAPHCAVAAACGANADCTSQNCVSGVCHPSCSGHCNQSTPCVVNADCGSQVCTNGLCAPPACSPECPPAAACGLNADCASLVCISNTCRPPSCSGHCNDGAACGVNADCSSRVCTNGICRSPACSPHCGSGAHCGQNSECTSQVCTNGLCR